MLEIQKKESKELKAFQKLLKYNHRSLSQSSRGNVYEETEQELGISDNIGTIPK